ncbi:hypothetical protein V8E36_000801 [Tilletia maclaganii]
MDPFEDPDNPGDGHDGHLHPQVQSNPEPQERQQRGGDPASGPSITTAASAAQALGAGTASPAHHGGDATDAAMGLTSPAVHPSSGAAPHANAMSLAAPASADLHASAALFGEDVASHDDAAFGAGGAIQTGAESVQLSTLLLPPAAQNMFTDISQAASSDLPSAETSNLDIEAQEYDVSASNASDALAASRSQRHRHRRPQQSSSSGSRRRDDGAAGGGLSATISSLRRGISRQIERERQQMGLSRSNLRDVYTADDEDEEDEDEGEEEEDHPLVPDRRQSSEDTEPGPEDIVEPEQRAGSASNLSASERRRSHLGRSEPGKGKGKARLSSSRTGSRAGSRSGGAGLGASTASVGARRRAMRVMSGKEKALWLWANVENMDAFLAEVYAYYMGKGAYCIALSRTLNLLTIAFVLCFSAFLLGCVDYSAIKHDGHLGDVIVPQCVNRFSFFAFLFLLALGGGFMWLVVRFGMGISRLVAMHGFYEHLLGIPDADVQAIPWHEVVNRISALRLSNPQDPSLAASIHAATGGATTGAAPSKTRLGLDAHDIANRIMRQENYLIALFNKDVLNLNVPFQVPLPSFLASILGLNSGQRVGMGKPKPVLTKSLEWNLHFCLLGFFFDSDGQLIQAVLRDRNREALVAGLRKRMLTMATLNAILAPFIIVYLLFFSFFRYFEEYHKNPANLGSRQYTQYARWKFREFNELPHLFKRRMRSSMPFAQRYTDQFPKERLVILARFVAFIAGSFTAVLLLASLYDPDLFLHFDITPQRNTLFYIGVFGGVLAVARGMIPEDNAVVDPELEIREVIRRTHFYPDEWRGRLHSAEVHADFGTMYMLKVYIFLTEMVSVIMTPFILWLSLPQSAPAIVDFFREFTVHVDGVGYVCSFAVFDFKRNGNVRFGAPADARDERMASKSGKMEQSFINFKMSNPDWLPADPSGSLFLTRLTETVARQQGGPYSRGRAPMDPHAGPYATSNYLHSGAEPGTATGAGMAESTLTARKALYDEAYNRSILLASKPRNAEALAASAIKVGSRTGSSNAAAQNRSRSASGRGQRALQVVDEDGDLFGEQPSSSSQHDDGRPGEAVDLLTGWAPRAMDESAALDAPFHSFVGESDFTAVPSPSIPPVPTPTATSRRSQGSAGVGSVAPGEGGSANQDQQGSGPLGGQGFKELIGNLYRSGGQPAVRSVW